VDFDAVVYASAAYASAAMVDTNALNNLSSMAVATVKYTDVVSSVSSAPLASAGAGSTVNAKVKCLNLGPSTVASLNCDTTVNRVGGGLVSLSANNCRLNGIGLPVVMPIASAAGGMFVECSVGYVQPSDASGAWIEVNSSSGVLVDTNVLNNTASSAVVSSVLTANLTANANLGAASSGLPVSASAGLVVSGRVRCINTGPNHALNMGCAVSAVDGGANGFNMTNNGCYLNGVGGSLTLPASSVGPNEYVECRLSYTQPNAVVVADYESMKQISVSV
jgi:hypothetical protein